MYENCGVWEGTWNKTIHIFKTFTFLCCLVHTFIEEIPLGSKVTSPERKQQDEVSQQHANAIAEFEITSSHFFMRINNHFQFVKFINSHFQFVQFFRLLYKNKYKRWNKTWIISLGISSILKCKCFSYVNIFFECSHRFIHYYKLTKNYKNSQLIRSSLIASCRSFNWPYTQSVLICQLQSWQGEKEYIRDAGRVSHFNSKMISQHFHLLIPLHHRISNLIARSDICFFLDNLFQKLKYRNK